MSSASAHIAPSGGASRPGRHALGSSTPPVCWQWTPPSILAPRGGGWAGVSAETVYQAFGSKSALLDALVRRAARLGDEAPIPEQAGPRAVVAERDQRTQLQMFAADIVRRLERVGPLMAVVDAAAVSEPPIAELQRGIDRARRAGLAEFVDALSARGPLSVDRAVAVDTVWALASSDLQQLLMRRRGWSRTAYATWLAESLARILLPG